MDNHVIPSPLSALLAAYGADVFLLPYEMGHREEQDVKLIPTVNEGSFTSDDTITISSTIEDLDTDSDIPTWVMDLQSREMDTSIVYVAVHTTSAYSFVAVTQEGFDFDTPLMTRINYEVIMRRLAPDTHTGAVM